MDEHQLICALKDLSLELGVTPTRTQFVTHVGKGSYQYETFFGNWNRFISASGLAPNRNSAQKLNNSIFEANIQSHLEKYQPTKVLSRPQYPSMLVISDIHWPFENKRVLKTFYECVGDVKPKYIFLNGDAWDMYSHSKFPRSHNIFTPRDEEKMAREANSNFWQEVKKLSPDSICYQMLGNHDIRPMKRVLEAYPEAEDWIHERMNKLFTFDRVKTIFDQREEVFIGDVAIFHGYRTKLGDHRDYTLFNTVNGHSHVGGVVFRRIRGQTLWEANSGLAGDPESKGLSYTPQRITNWTPGFLEIDKWGPKFIWV